MKHLFLLFAELFLLQTNALSSKLLGKQGAVTEMTCLIPLLMIMRDIFLLFGMDGPRKFLGTICLIQDIMSQGLKVSEVRADIHF